jgi:membrane protease YdiL (CAAX protease family)
MTSIPLIARRVRSAGVMNGTVTFGRSRDLVFAAIVTLAIPYLASVPLGLFTPLTDRFDAPRYWALPTLHQLLAAALAIVAIKLVSTKPLSEWGFNTRQLGRSLFHVVVFAIVVTVPVYLLRQSTPAPTGEIDRFGIAAVLFTHLFVISTTQEILYRGLLQTFLETQWAGSWRVLGIGWSRPGVLAAVIFTLSHVRPYPPFIWPAQLFLAFGYGLAYAFMYDRTRSLVGPSLAHGYSNAAYVALLMLPSA